ncbi:hypothetical protein [Acinetobacter radioresistens]|uniref:hypothetical protein n=1 Tax=Acinetobacter radioresistens TaxID=40216 RepID=UPI000C323956|nr:hypothetical protein [Acinetobacter radioresistens]PKH35612.1 hypothetical protein BJF94_01195 [Acinetobacter radioresistens]
MKNLLVIALAASTIAITGCTMRIADMTVASTKNYNLNSNEFIKGERVTGEDKVPVILFPLGIPNFKTAIDRAIEKNPCSVALSDVVITQLNQAFLVGQIGYRVEGSQVIDLSQPNCRK